MTTAPTTRRPRKPVLRDRPAWQENWTVDCPGALPAGADRDQQNEAWDNAGFGRMGDIVDALTDGREIPRPDGVSVASYQAVLDHVRGVMAQWAAAEGKRLPAGTPAVISAGWSATGHYIDNGRSACGAVKGSTMPLSAVEPDQPCERCLEIREAAGMDEIAENADLDDKLDAALKAGDDQAAPPFDPAVVHCSTCNRPATCHGTYEGVTGYGCDVCCGHGNEDGQCRPTAKLQSAPPISAAPAAQLPAADKISQPDIPPVVGRKKRSDAGKPRKPKPKPAPLTAATLVGDIVTRGADRLVLSEVEIEDVDDCIFARMLRPVWWSGLFAELTPTGGDALLKAMDAVEAQTKSAGQPPAAPPLVAVAAPGEEKPKPTEPVLAPTVPDDMAIILFISDLKGFDQAVEDAAANLKQAKERRARCAIAGPAVYMQRG